MLNIPDFLKVALTYLRPLPHFTLTQASKKLTTLINTITLLNNNADMQQTHTKKFLSDLIRYEYIKSFLSDMNILLDTSVLSVFLSKLWGNFIKIFLLL
jgi:hypothetical protein